MRCHNQPITLLAPASFNMSAACGERFFVLYKVMMITLQRVPQESDMSSSKTHTRSLTSPTLSRCGLELYQMPLLVRNPHDCHYLQDMSRTECAIKVLDSWPCLLAKTRSSHQYHLVDLPSLHPLLVHQGEVEAQLRGKTSAPGVDSDDCIGDYHDNDDFDYDYNDFQETSWPLPCPDWPGLPLPTPGGNSST